MKPRMVWVKAADPRGGGSGTAMATTALAAALAEDFDLHLVCFGGETSKEDGTDSPFASVRTVRADHQRSRVRSALLGAWYVLLQIIRVAPIAESIESSRAMRRAVARAIQEEGASVVLGEHWPLGRLISRTPGVIRVIRLVDVEHENVRTRIDRSEGVSRLWLRWTHATVRRSEVRAAERADEALAVSGEDAAAFTALGVGLRHIPVSIEPQPRRKTPTAGQMVFLGRLDWWPNVEGLSWFFREVWPLVRIELPGAELRIVGGGTGDLPDLDWPLDGVKIVGWVEDLASELRCADVGVVPVHFGTGVKIKTLVLMAAGLPTVSTTCGSRGTAGLAGGAVIADDAAEFADFVVELIKDRQRNTEQSMAAIDAIRQEHDAASAHAFSQSLLERLAHGG